MVRYLRNVAFFLLQQFNKFIVHLRCLTFNLGMFYVLIAFLTRYLLPLSSRWHSVTALAYNSLHLCILGPITELSTT